MVERKVMTNHVEKILEKLTAENGQPRVLNEEEVGEVYNSVNEEMKETARDYRRREAMSEIGGGAARTYITS